MNKTRVYGWILTGFFWLVQLNDIQRVLWFFRSLMADEALAAWLMTLVVELGMGLLSLELLRRITANNQRQKRDGKFIGYKQPSGLLWLSVVVLGGLETLISVSFFYEFGQVTRLTERMLSGDTLWTAIVFGSVSAVLTFVFAAVEGERARIAEREDERAEAKAERARAKREQADTERVSAAEEHRIANELPYPCSGCDRRFATKQALSGHQRWCKGADK